MAGYWLCPVTPEEVKPRRDYEAFIKRIAERNQFRQRSDPGFIQRREREGIQGRRGRSHHTGVGR